MKITQTVEKFAAFHQEPHGNSTWFLRLTIEETPPADLLQTFQPNLAQGPLLLVVIQTSSVQHDISISLSCCLARKSCDRLRSGQSANTSQMSGANKKQDDSKKLVLCQLWKTRRLRRRQSFYFSNKDAKSHFEATVFDRVQQTRDEKRVKTSGDGCPKHTKMLVFGSEGAQLDSLVLLTQTIVCLFDVRCWETGLPFSLGEGGTSRILSHNPVH